MTYSKTTWVDDSTVMNAARLGNMETQYDEAMATMRKCTQTPGSSRAFDTNYQNTSGVPLWVCVSTTVGNNIGVTALIGASSPPATVIAHNFKSGATFVGTLPILFLVPPSYYYRLTKTGSPTKVAWCEWALHG